LGINAPEVLTEAHDISNFCCGRQDLDDWLIKKALKNQNKNNIKVYVATELSSHLVVGYYAIAMGSVQRESAIGSLRRNSPNPIPMLVLARLGVHVDYHGQGIGAGLLKDCVIRSVHAMNVVGGAGILVHAINDAAKEFYKKFGFTESPFEAMTLMARTCDIAVSHK
jgi:ribosomal protein S18 acetylase RimI-like enzyme